MKILDIKSSSYYYSKKEKRNQRAIENRILLSYIRLIWRDSKKRYGSKKVNWMGYTLVDTKDKEICYTKEK